MQICNGRKIGLSENCMRIMHWQGYWFILGQAYGRTNTFGNMLKAISKHFKIVNYKQIKPFGWYINQ